MRACVHVATSSRARAPPVLPPAPGDTHAEIRRRFEANRGVRDLYAVKFNLSDGRASLKALREMKGMTTRA